MAAQIAKPGWRAQRSNAGRDKMALRRQLQKLFQEPQLSGAITVERPLFSTAAARFCASPPVSPPASPSSLSSASVSLSPPRRQGPLPAECAMFQCGGCWAVLGDSLHLCAQEERRLGLLVCYRVTNNVVWEDSLMIGLEGALLGCAYNVLACQSCGSNLGFILYSAPSDLAYLRGLFCFFKDSIICYLLEKQIIIQASKVNFPAVTLEEPAQKLKEKIVKAHIRIELLMRKVEELERKNDVAERRRPASDAVVLPPGYAIVRIN